MLSSYTYGITADTRPEHVRDLVLARHRTAHLGWVDVLFEGTPVSVLFCYSLALERYTYRVMCWRTDDDGLSLHAFIETLDPSCLYDLLAIAAQQA